MFLNLLTTIIHLPVKNGTGYHLNILLDNLIVPTTPKELQKFIIWVVIAFNQLYSILAYCNVPTYEPNFRQTLCCPIADSHDLVPMRNLAAKHHNISLRMFNYLFSSMILSISADDAFFDIYFIDDATLCIIIDNG